jgi:hypothetical protein
MRVISRLPWVPAPGGGAELDALELGTVDISGRVLLGVNGDDSGHAAL